MWFPHSTELATFFAFSKVVRAARRTNRLPSLPVITPYEPCVCSPETNRTAFDDVQILILESLASFCYLVAGL